MPTAAAKNGGAPAHRRGGERQRRGRDQTAETAQAEGEPGEGGKLPWWKPPRVDHQRSHQRRGAAETHHRATEGERRGIGRAGENQRAERGDDEKQ